MKEEIARGEDAKRILHDPLYQEAWTAVERSFIEHLRQVPLTDASLEREFVRSLQLLYKVRQYLEQVMQTGTLAALDEQQKHWQEQKEDLRARRRTRG